MMIRSKRLPVYVAAGAGLSALAVGAAMMLSNSGSTASAVSAAPPSTVITTRATRLGQILVDAQGRSLYLFAKDTGPASTCAAGCSSVWPPVPVSRTPQAEGSAAAASVGVITGPGGRQQLSYAGHPLYYFLGDKKAGQSHGQGLDEFGAKWFVVNPAGAAVHGAPVAAQSGGASGGYGY